VPRTSHSTRVVSRFAAVLLLLAVTAGTPAPARAGDSRSGMLEIRGGAYRPFYKGKSGGRTIPVDSFLLDREPVTQTEFLGFVTRNPRWRRSLVTPLFAEPGYLGDWSSDLKPAGRASAPVTRVSWFAASAYCECEGKRLPTQAEWEWAAERTRASAAAVPASVIRLAAFEPSTPATKDSGRLSFATGRSGSGLAFGDVWEWTSDFNTLLLADPSPDESSASSLFCGDGFRATDAKDYGGFLRFSFRSSLKANYALRNLGFRCAKDLK